jgi:hypothetical protein
VYAQETDAYEYNILVGYLTGDWREGEMDVRLMTGCICLRTEHNDGLM